MTDNELIRIIVPLINLGLKSLNNEYYSYVTVMQNYEPTQQGIPSNPTVYYQKIHSHNYGAPSQENFYDDTDMKFKLRQKQLVLSRWQFNFNYTQLPENTSLPTASDLAQQVCFILQNYYSVQYLGQQNIGILRITDIINPYFLQDRDQYYANPSFDVIFTYYVESIYSSQVITPPADLQIFEV